MPNLTPSQEAREAAAAFYADLHDVWEGYSACVAMREGYADNDPFVRFAARFEAAIRKDEAEQCARVADKAAENKFGGTVRSPIAQEIATALRARHAGGRGDD